MLLPETPAVIRPDGTGREVEYFTPDMRREKKSEDRVHAQAAELQRIGRRAERLIRESQSLLAATEWTLKVAAEKLHPRGDHEPPAPRGRRGTIGR
jgi:hypothetical protein